MSYQAELSGFNHFDRTDGKDEWLTPPEIVASLGQFDLDPCSPISRPWPTAKNHFTVNDDGLMQDWTGRVWCNPPYGDQTGIWLERMSKHKNGIALIFARTETNMFFDFIWNKAHSVFFVKQRISFYDVSGKKGGPAGAPSCLVSWDEINTETLKQICLPGKLIKI